MDERNRLRIAHGRDPGRRRPKGPPVAGFRRTVDLLIDQGTGLTPVEAKSGQTVTRSFFTGLRKWRQIAGDAADRAWLVYGGDRRESRANVEVLPWRELGELGESVA